MTATIEEIQRAIAKVQENPMPRLLLGMESGPEVEARLHRIRALASKDLQCPALPLLGVTMVPGLEGLYVIEKGRKEWRLA